MLQNTPSGGCVRLVCLISVFGLLAGCILLDLLATNPFGLGTLVFGRTAQAQPQVHAQLVLTGSYSVVGGPSLPPSFINTVLARAGSPAQGTGQSLYDLSQRYHIDDAYALAFFQHESSYGRNGMARTTRSLGNIRCAGYATCLSGFRAYPTWQAGYADWYHLIATAYVARGLTTVPRIIPVYAPSGDVSGYIRAVETSVTQWQKRGQV